MTYESNCDRNKTLSLEEHFNTIELYLSDIIIDLQESDTRKLQLTIAVNFMSSKDAEEERVTHSIRENIIKFMSYNDADEVVHKFFEPLYLRYHRNFEISMEWS